MKLPPEILAFKLLNKANIKEDKLLVLTGMDFPKKDILYEEAKRSLKNQRRFVRGRGCDWSKYLEPAFLATHEEALLAAGYVKGKSRVYSGKTTVEEDGVVVVVACQEPQQETVEISVMVSFFKVIKTVTEETGIMRGRV